MVGCYFALCYNVNVIRDVLLTCTFDLNDPAMMLFFLSGLITSSELSCRLGSEDYI